jgi:hypothetical protein
LCDGPAIATMKQIKSLATLQYSKVYQKALQLKFIH